MQRRERIRSPGLPIPNPLLQRILPRNPQRAPVIPARDVITKVDCLSQQPDCLVDPVAVAEDRLGDPPASQAVVERGEREPQAFLVRKRELDVLDHEDPE